jgi:hypothetical protein
MSWWRNLLSGLCATAGLFSLGCGTTRMTDTTRAASEMLLVSQAIDHAVTQIDCAELCGKEVFFDTQYLDGTVDKGYLISSIRQHLLAHGVKIKDDRKSAGIVVEARSGAVGTDRHGLLVGIPQMSVPALIPGQLTQIPEIGLIKKTDMKGVAKLALFAYHRESGEAYWQSGLKDARSTLKDTWVFGAGPFSRGTIRRRTELAGEELPRLPLPFSSTSKEETDLRAKAKKPAEILPIQHDEAAPIELPKPKPEK